VSAEIDRRTALKAGAWALPVIAVAVATPAAAASGSEWGPPPTFTWSVNPGSYGYTLSLVVGVTEFWLMYETASYIQIQPTGAPQAALTTLSSPGWTPLLSQGEPYQVYAPASGQFAQGEYVFEIEFASEGSEHATYKAVILDDANTVIAESRILTIGPTPPDELFVTITAYIEPAEGQYNNLTFVVLDAYGGGMAGLEPTIQYEDYGGGWNDVDTANATGIDGVSVTQVIDAAGSDLVFLNYRGWVNVYGDIWYSNPVENP
jgi:hypothetical protein